MNNVEYSIIRDVAVAGAREMMEKEIARDSELIFRHIGKWACWRFDHIVNLNADMHYESCSNQLYCDSLVSHLCRVQEIVAKYVETLDVELSREESYKMISENTEIFAYIKLTKNFCFENYFC